MQGAPEKKNSETAFPSHHTPYTASGNNSQENLLDFVDILQQELIRAEVLPADYDFESHDFESTPTQEPLWSETGFPMQPERGGIRYFIITYADDHRSGRGDFGFKPSTSLVLRKYGSRYFIKFNAEDDEQAHLGRRVFLTSEDLPTFHLTLQFHLKAM